MRPDYYIRTLHSAVSRFAPPRDQPRKQLPLAHQSVIVQRECSKPEREISKERHSRAESVQSRQWGGVHVPAGAAVPREGQSLPTSFWNAPGSLVPDLTGIDSSTHPRGRKCLICPRDEPRSGVPDLTWGQHASHPIDSANILESYRWFPRQGDDRR